MHRESEHSPELVSAARAGDGPARERLVADYLPLVYNIVGRALDGHADVDDVVQDTMFRALDGLGGLREPSRFRPWLVAIAMNQIRRRWRDRQLVSVASLDRAEERPDPAGDFVDLTILRLGLSGQRREVAEATRWLDEDDRELLALWWQEAAGELTRAELADALGVPARHAAVRVQRMKERLETGRVVVRALGARPRCRELARLTDDWDGRPAGVWRKRVARHARGCRTCGGHWANLVPAEGLLAGLALVVPLSGYPSVPVDPSALAASSGAAVGPGPAPEAAPVPPAEPVPAADPGVPGYVPADTGVPGDVPADAGLPGYVPGDAGLPGTAGSAAGPGHITSGPSGVDGPAYGFAPAGPGSGGAGAGRWAVYAQAGGVAAGVLLLWLLWPSGEPGGVPAAPHGAIRSQAPASSAPARKQAAVPSPRPSVSASPTAPPPSPSPSASRPAAPPVEQRLTDLVNARRARAGCGPLRLDPRLTAAARAHARDMVARGYFDHADPEGRHADARIADAGYRASAWAENLHRGPRDAATVVEDWMDGSVHEENMLGCTYRDTGVAAVPGPDGTVWVQTLAGPVGR